jgi:preprotein translocase subunit SecB
MLLSPIRLDSYYFEELAFRHDEKFDAAQNHASAPLNVEDLKASIDYGHQADSERTRFYRLHLELPPLDGRYSCSFRAVAVGFFSIDESCSDEQLTMTANTNAPAVLYGVMREAVAALSGRGPLPPLCLPSVNFLDFSRHAEAQFRAAQEEAARELPAEEPVREKKPRKSKAKV